MFNELINTLDKKILAFGITGSGQSSKIISELINNNINYIDVNHEASAAIMAGVVSEVSNYTGMSISIKGPGLSNMVPGIVNNFLENRFTISVSEAFNQNQNGLHKNIKQYELLSNITKCQFSLSNLNLFSENFSYIKSLSSPIHVHLCQDDRFYISDQQVINDILKIEGHKKISVIFGKACKNKINPLNIPFFCTASCKGNFIENEFFCGVYSGNGDYLTHENILDSSDLIIGVEIKDCELLNKKHYIKNINFETFQNILHLLDNSWGLDLINEKNIKKSGFNVDSWTPTGCMRILNNLNYNFNVVVDTGLFCLHAEYFLTCNKNKNFTGSLNSRYMGTAIPSAIGYSLVSNQPIMCLFGDGSTSYLNEIDIVIKHKKPICFILFSDGRYGTIVSNNNNINEILVNKTFPWIRIFESFNIESYFINSLNAFYEHINKWNRLHSLFLCCKFDQNEYINSSIGLRI